MAAAAGPETPIFLRLFHCRGNLRPPSNLKRNKSNSKATILQIKDLAGARVEKKIIYQSRGSQLLKFI
jgi:hypothetical protein